MKSRIQYLLVFLIIFPLPFYSCQEDPEADLWTCPDTRYDVDSFEELQINGSSYDSTDTLKLNTLTLEFLFEVSKTPTSDAVIPRSRGSFLFPSATALSCLGPHGTERLRIVRITSDSDFSETFPAGVNLLSNFTSIYSNGLLEDIYIEVTGFSQPDQELHGYTSIELIEFPSAADTHVFTVEIELEEGRRFTATTAPIQFN